MHLFAFSFNRSEAAASGTAYQLSSMEFGGELLSAPQVPAKDGDLGLSGDLDLDNILVS